eukprot:TRINITY_DN8347_c0_g1_i2.p1 TRINITY_DN8347_c0_g1~~TRINITY_DN8347_c0_g1_i2.p1  ORF type:complete len:381 (-),score=59.35 TRINITY_DN8347_c0_g1_i2:1587-2624(-)
MRSSLPFVGMKDPRAYRLWLTDKVFAEMADGKRPIPASVLHDPQVICREASASSSSEVVVLQFATPEQEAILRALAFVEPPGAPVGKVQRTLQSILRLQPSGQSYEVDSSYHVPYITYMLLAPLFLEQVLHRDVTKAKVLCAGLGAGDLPGFLQKYFPKMSMDVVEFDAKVIELAQRFFHFVPSRNTKMHNRDVTDFVRAAKAGTYDLVFLDVFTGDNSATVIPEHAQEEEFLRRAAASLKPGTGVLVQNITSSVANDPLPRLKQLYTDIYGEENCFVVPVSYDQCLIMAVSPPKTAQPQNFSVLTSDFRNVATEFSHRHKLPVDLAAFHQEHVATWRKNRVTVS